MVFGVNSRNGYGYGTADTEPFPDPFMDYASLTMPTSISDALSWCESILLANGIYRAAMDRVVSYFITDVEIKGEERSVKKKYSEYLNDNLGIKSLLRELGMDYITYGNIFVSVLKKDVRYVVCPSCGFQTTAEHMTNSPYMNFQWRFGFYGRCRCGFNGEFKRNDRPSTDVDDIYIKRWNPKELEIIWDPYTEDTDYVWKIPDSYRNLIQRGSKFHVTRANWDVVSAIKTGQFFRINRDLIYHGKEQTLAGVVNRGWGISRLLTNYRQARYVQVLHRINEAVGSDYIIPLRVITPEARSGAGGAVVDPMMSLDMGGFTGSVNSMLHQRRFDPASWFTLPFPVKYSVLGGEANQLAPYQLLDQAMDTLLTSSGLPVDFYKGTLTIQAAPVALRLLESNWSHLLFALNRALQWIVDRVARLMRWDEVKVSLVRSSHMDDLNRQLAKMQLMMQREISKSTGLKSIGLDLEEEQDRIMEEEQLVAEKAKETQKKLEASGLSDLMAAGQMGPMGQQLPGGQIPGGLGQGMGDGGGMGGGGMAMPSGDPVEAVMSMLPQSAYEKLTPQEIEERASSIAQMLYAMPESLKDSTLRRIKQQAPVVHGLVISALSEMRRSAAVQGIAASQQQAQSGQVTPPM